MFKLKFGDFWSLVFLSDFYLFFEILCEDYFCYWDWLSNGFWVF